MSTLRNVKSSEEQIFSHCIHLNHCIQGRRLPIRRSEAIGVPKSPPSTGQRSAGLSLHSRSACCHCTGRLCEVHISESRKAKYKTKRRTRRRPSTSDMEYTFRASGKCISITPGRIRLKNRTKLEAYLEETKEAFQLLGNAWDRDRTRGEDEMQQGLLPAALGTSFPKGPGYSPLLCRAALRPDFCFDLAL